MLGVVHRSIVTVLQNILFSHRSERLKMQLVLRVKKALYYKQLSACDIRFGSASCTHFLLERATGAGKRGAKYEKKLDLLATQPLLRARQKSSCYIGLR